MGRNYGPHVFFQGFKHSNNYGANLNKNQGHTRSKGGAKTRSGGTGESDAEGRAWTTQRASSWQTSTSKTETEATSRTTGYQIGGGVAETFHQENRCLMRTKSTRYCARSLIAIAIIQPTRG